MDPTLQAAGGMPQQVAASDPQAAMRNAMMLKAIQSGAAGGAHPPPGAAQAMGQPQMMTPPPVPAVPVNPQAMQGGMGGPPTGGMHPPMDPQAMQGQNPVAAALMSQIPGAGGQ